MPGKAPQGLTAEEQKIFNFLAGGMDAINWSTNPLSIQGGVPYIEAVMRNSNASSLFTEENIFALEAGESKNIHMIWALLRDLEQERAWLPEKAPKKLEPVSLWTRERIAVTEFRNTAETNKQKVIKLANQLKGLDVSKPENNKQRKAIVTQLASEPLKSTVSDLLSTAQKTSVLIDDDIRNIAALPGNNKAGVFYSGGKFYAVTSVNIDTLSMLLNSETKEMIAKQAQAISQSYETLEAAIEALGLMQNTCTLCCDFDGTITQGMTIKTLPVNPSLNQNVVDGLVALKTQGFSVSIATRNTEAYSRSLTPDELKVCTDHLDQLVQFTQSTQSRQRLFQDEATQPQPQPQPQPRLRLRPPPPPVLRAYSSQEPPLQKPPVQTTQWPSAPPPPPPVNHGSRAPATLTIVSDDFIVFSCETDKTGKSVSPSTHRYGSCLEQVNDDFTLKIPKSDIVNSKLAQYAEQIIQIAAARGIKKLILGDDVNSAYLLPAIKTYLEAHSEYGSFKIIEKNHNADTGIYEAVPFQQSQISKLPQCQPMEKKPPKPPKPPKPLPRPQAK